MFLHWRLTYKNMDLDLNLIATYNQIWQDQYSVFKVTSSCWFCMISVRIDNFIACHLCQNYKFFIAIKNAHVGYRQISILNQFYRLWVLRICAFQDSIGPCWLVLFVSQSILMQFLILNCFVILRDQPMPLFLYFYKWTENIIYADKNFCLKLGICSA